MHQCLYPNPPPDRERQSDDCNGLTYNPGISSSRSLFLFSNALIRESVQSAIKSEPHACRTLVGSRGSSQSIPSSPIPLLSPEFRPAFNIFVKAVFHADPANTETSFPFIVAVVPAPGLGFDAKSSWCWAFQFEFAIGIRRAEARVGSRTRTIKMPD